MKTNNIQNTDKKDDQILEELIELANLCIYPDTCRVDKERFIEVVKESFDVKRK